MRLLLNMASEVPNSKRFHKKNDFLVRIGLFSPSDHLDDHNFDGLLNLETHKIFVAFCICS